MKTLSLHNQSTSQTPSDNEATQALPDPGHTQRIAWTPPNTALRLTVTPGGGPQPDPRTRRNLLGSITAVFLILFLIWRLPFSRPSARPPIVAPPAAPHLVQQVVPRIKFEPLPPPLYYSRPGSDADVRVYLVAPSVPMSE